MCTCASCSYTDGFSGWKTEKGPNGELQPDYQGKGGFANWPRGNLAGRRASESSYKAHVAHMWHGIARGWEFKPGQPARAPHIVGLVHPVQPNATAIRWNAGRGKKPEPARAPARPTQPGKAKQHFPELDRQPEAGAVIYAMAKSKEKKPIGRPALPGRRVVIKLEEEQIKRAANLGDGNVAEGIRRALRQSSG